MPARAGPRETYLSPCRRSGPEPDKNSSLVGLEAWPTFGRNIVPRKKGLQRHHPRKGKPVVRLGRKAKGRNCSPSPLRRNYGSLVAERMLALVEPLCIHTLGRQLGCVPSQREVDSANSTFFGFGLYGSNGRPIRALVIQGCGSLSRRPVTGSD